jgi:hypothetical protein
MNNPRWVVALSPDGGARAVAEKTAVAFRDLLGSDSCRVFDSRTYRDGYKKLLRQPDDQMVVDLLNQSLAVSCFDFQATHCLVGALCPATLFTLNLLRKHGITTVHWLYEDFRRAVYWKEVLSGYDHFCAIQRGPLPAACGEAGVSYHFLPTAGLTAELPLPEHPRLYDIGFVGIPSDYRISVLEGLSAAGLSVACGGEGWGGYRGILKKGIVSATWMTDEATLQLFSRSKIGINLSFADPADREHMHISPRACDIMAAGALLLTESSSLIGESLPGCSFTAFASPSAARSQALALLADYSSLGDAIAKNRRTVLDRHTYRCRVRDIVSFAG